MCKGELASKTAERLERDSVRPGSRCSDYHCSPDYTNKNWEPAHGRFRPLGAMGDSQSDGGESQGDDQSARRPSEASGRGSAQDRTM